MKEQQSFSDIEYGMRKRTTKREEFLGVINEVICWDEWCAYIHIITKESIEGLRIRHWQIRILIMRILSFWKVAALPDAGLPSSRYIPNNLVNTSANSFGYLSIFNRYRHLSHITCLEYSLWLYFFYDPLLWSYQCLVRFIATSFLE